MLILIGIIIVIVFVYFLIIRPLTQRYRPQVFGPVRNNYEDDPNYYRPASPSGMVGWSGSGIGRFGTFAGGLATGALLTYLLDQGRIGFDQYQSLQNLGDHELLRELEDQNILQQDEINQLRDQINGSNEDGFQNDYSEEQNLNYDNSDYNNDWQQDNHDFGGWDDSSDDNWV